ncbi:MAG TPA: hypothetical protein VN651_10940 [Gemmatimonadaceae bacterium]|nr:hypothetical protein [Gemmatimonadaceae bacterium]
MLHASFAAWLITVRPPWTAVFDAGSWYGFADGTLGLLVAAILVGSTSRQFDTLPARARWSLRHLVAGATLVDAVGRLLVSSALRAMPGLSELPMVLVPLFAATGVSVTLLGAVMAVAWVMSRRGVSPDARRGVHALFDPLAMSAVVAFGAAAVLIVGPPATAASLRSLAVAVSATFAALFAVAALGVATLRPTAPAPPAARIWKL